MVESATLPGERRFATTLEALRTNALPRADGPVVLLVGEAFADTLETSQVLPHLPLKTASKSS